MGGWQGISVVAQMVLAELAGVVAKIEQKLGDRRGAGPEIRRATGQLRRNHAGAQRMHTGEECITTRRAALLGVVLGELRAFLTDLVDVRRFADHQALMVDARLHPPNVVAHDEEDVGLLLLLSLGGPQAPPQCDYGTCRGHYAQKQSAFHELSPILARGRQFPQNGSYLWRPSSLAIFSH